MVMQRRRSCPVRDKIMRKYDKELLGAPLWCTTQKEEGLWIQGVNIMDRRGESSCMIEAVGELDCFSAHIRLRSLASQRIKPICLSINEGELLGRHSGVEAGGRKGRGSNDESNEAQLPKSKASIRKEVDSKKRHSAAEVDLPITKEGMKMQGNR
ncbi:hypothetical protein BHE74_00055604 [Ensete ventricosum]|nr:hypothetical protein BHE74_00055604 [Ensete ventricosum]